LKADLFNNLSTDCKQLINDNTRDFCKKVDITVEIKNLINKGDIFKSKMFLEQLNSYVVNNQNNLGNNNNINVKNQTIKNELFCKENVDDSINEDDIIIDNYGISNELNIANQTITTPKIQDDQSKSQ